LFSKAVVAVRYPASLDEFYQARLPGTFDESKAGKRMKLPIPETWETQVALKGNKASTWQDLIGSLNHTLSFYQSFVICMLIDLLAVVAVV